MAKKIVKVNEEKIRGYMVGDIPDAIENEDIIVVEVPEEKNNERQDTEKETARKIPYLAICLKVTVTFVKSIW